jgi:hypothetical protein
LAIFIENGGSAQTHILTKSDSSEDARLGSGLASLSGTFGCSSLCLLLPLSKSTFSVPSYAEARLADSSNTFFEGGTQIRGFKPSTLLRTFLPVRFLPPIKPQHGNYRKLNTLKRKPTSILPSPRRNPTSNDLCELKIFASAISDSSPVFRALWNSKLVYSNTRILCLDFWIPPRHPLYPRTTKAQS